MIDEFIAILQLLVKTPSVVGNERVFLRLIQRECESLGLRTTEYEGVLEVCGIKDTDIVLSAHVDRNGLICTGPNEFQYAAFSAKFGADLDGSSVSERLLGSIEKRFINHSVVAYDPWTGAYIGQSKITDSYISPQQNNLIFNINPISAITPGVPLAYNDELSIEKNWISAQLDNVFSVAVILLLYRQGYQGRAVFTCEEEAGKSWRYLRAYFRRRDESPQRLLVLDTSPVNSEQDAISIDVVLRNRDISAEFNAPFTAQLVAICDALNAHYIKKDEYVDDPAAMGRTELGRLIAGSDGTMTGTTFQFPTTNYHTAQESYDMSSFEKAMSVLKTIIG
ncbi:MAG: peptidase M42 [bacterium]|nr:peptidase M42 [bacterium]